MIRIAVCNWSNRRVGGTEAYLGNVTRYLHHHGFAVSLFHEMDRPVDRELIALPWGTPTWCVETLGRTRAVEALREWRPDVVYTNIIESLDLEAELIGIAPTVFDAHAFYGTCVGGHKCFKFPEPTPCTRTFGWKCLLHYYPRRCGGLSPVTMIQRYRHERTRHALLPRYAAVITHSDFMRAEYIRHGVQPGRAFNVSAGLFDNLTSPTLSPGSASAVKEPPPGSRDAASRPVQLLFVGRMDLLKGGHYLIRALPRIRASLGRDVALVLAGEGPARAEWERLSRKLVAADSGCRVDFPGWVSGDALDALYAAADLLVVPSLWPEPFGRIGLEAGRHGLPAAAYAVGGIPDWLTDGLNGHLASGSPPSVEGIAEAVTRCLQDPMHHAQLRRGAAVQAEKGGTGGSWPMLLDIFHAVGK